jgi:hypothetical protein
MLHFKDSKRIMFWFLECCSPILFFMHKIFINFFKNPNVFFHHLINLCNNPPRQEDESYTYKLQFRSKKDLRREVSPHLNSRRKIHPTPTTS